MRELNDPWTGEVFACVPLAQWRELVQLAREVRPCTAPPPCEAPGCRLALAVIREAERGDPR